VGILRKNLVSIIRNQQIGGSNPSGALRLFLK
jgi:hypothetical protein